MQSATQSAPVSKKKPWAGIIISALPALFLLFSGVMKLVKPPVVVEGTIQYGYSESVIIPLGIVLIACTVIYLIPRTAVLGAILLTGYLGGAVDTHVRAGEGCFRSCSRSFSARCSGEGFICAMSGCARSFLYARNITVNK